jgi:hypothetical protein
MKLSLFLLLVLSLTAFVDSTLGQSPITKGDWVVPKFETEISSYKFKPFVGMQETINIAEVSPGVISINGDLKWDKGRLPTLRAYQVNDIKQSKNKSIEITLRNEALTTQNGIRMQLKLLIDPVLDVDRTLSALLFKGNVAEFLKSDYLSKRQDEILPRMFTGSLSTIPLDVQKKLHIWVKLNNSAFKEVVYKDKKYISLQVPNDVVYNTIQLNQAERTARQTEKSLIDLKEVFAITGSMDGLDGIKIESTISSYNFVRKDEQTVEKFEMLVTFDVLKKYVEADITNQDMVDSAIILLDGSRMKVNITSFS